MTVVGELWGRRRVIPGLSVHLSFFLPSLFYHQIFKLPGKKFSFEREKSTDRFAVCDYFSLGHNWFGDEWPSLGLTEEEFLAEYSKTLHKLAETHTRWMPIFVFVLVIVLVFVFALKTP